MTPDPLSDDLWKTVPVRTAEWKIDEDSGLVVILKPKFSSQKINKLLKPIMRGETIRIKLDDVGSSIWNSFDGKRSLTEIAALIEKEFKEKVTPVEVRLKTFIMQLHRSDFIKLGI